MDSEGDFFHSELVLRWAERQVTQSALGAGLAGLLCCLLEIFASARDSFKSAAPHRDSETQASLEVDTRFGMSSVGMSKCSYICELYQPLQVLLSHTYSDTMSSLWWPLIHRATVHKLVVSQQPIVAHSSDFSRFKGY